MDVNRPDVVESAQTLCSQKPSSVSVEIAIVGGGIAGLWLLNRLRRAGYDAVLFEKKALGCGQTLASQGIIHGGLKYALNGVLSPASSAIADMPDRWRACLNGEGEIDLRATQVLSPHYYMWSSGSVRSRLKTFLGSKALHGRIDALTSEQYPGFFKSTGSSIKGTLYRLADFVVDTPSLIRNLAAAHPDTVFKCQNIVMQPSTNGPSLMVENADGLLISVQAEKVILCAGEGNEALLASERQVTPVPEMQRRPLHMVALKVHHPVPAYLHCIGDGFGMTPRLTITCHPCSGADPDNPQWIWYLGGEIAESGVRRDSDAQLAFAIQELTALFPWMNFSKANGCSFFINRAEPRVHNLQRPDNAYVEQCADVLVCWPTKLTLCPNLGDSVMDLLKDFAPKLRRGTGAPTSSTQLAAHFSRPDLASPPWEGLL
jgi:glycine/D-amino acid oxidase-like deaminating enzyme